MSEALKISDTLSLPLRVVANKMAFFGGNGSGKSYGATKCAEEMWRVGAQFVAFDPVGIWYGLRIGHGDKPGLPIVVFGGLHGDIPIGPHDGKTIAEVIAGEGISAVVDVSQFETDGQKGTFASDFAERFFFLKKAKPGAVHIFLEEAQEFVPQQPAGGPSSKETLMSNRFQRLWKIGRNFGIGGSLISPRPQEISKATVNLSECVFCFRLSGPQERDYMQKWLAEKGSTMAADLPSVKTGEPFIWSPFLVEFVGYAKISEKNTEDVSATPTVGQEFSSRVLTPVAVEALRGRLAKVETEEFKDLATARKRIAELEKQVKEGSASEAVIAREVAIAVKPLEDRNKHLEWIIGEVYGISQRLSGIADLEARVNRNAAEDRSLEIPSEMKLSPAKKEPEEDSGPKAAGTKDPRQRILDVLASFSQIGVAALDRDTLALFCDIAPTTKSHTYAISGLLKDGLIEIPAKQVGRLGLTLDGSALANVHLSADSLTLAKLHELWIARLRGKDKMAEVLEFMLSARSHRAQRVEIASSLGLSPTTKSFTYGISGLLNLGVLRAAGVGIVELTDVLFPDGLK